MKDGILDQKARLVERFRSRRGEIDEKNGEKHELPAVFFMVSV